MLLTENTRRYREDYGNSHPIIECKVAPARIRQEQPACVRPGVYDGQTSVLQLWQAPASFEWWKCVQSPSNSIWTGWTTSPTTLAAWMCWPSCGTSCWTPRTSSSWGFPWMVLEFELSCILPASKQGTWGQHIGAKCSFAHCSWLRRHF